MKITLEDRELGKCEVTSDKNVKSSVKYVIKSLCALQMMCINSSEDKEKIEEFIEILKNAIDKIDDLYNNEEMLYNVTEQF